MRKLNKKKISILIIIIIMVIVEIVALEFSKGRDIKEIELTIIDNDGILNTEEITLQAVNDDKSGYYIVLPQTANGKIVTKYFVEEKPIQQVEELITNESVQVTENVIESTIDNTVEDIEQNVVDVIEKENEVSNEVIIVEKVEGDKIYLTEEELETQTMTLRAEFDSKEVGVNTFYNKIIGEVIDDTLIELQGYMPLESQIALGYANAEDVEELSQSYLNEETLLDAAYDIKIISGEEQYNPLDFEENVIVTISGAEDFHQNRKYKILHIKETNEIEVIDKVEATDGQISFETKSFSTYVILSEPSDDIIGEEIQFEPAILMRTVALASTANNWDGSTAEDFTYGDGTFALPYLITSGAELAYLRDRVNAGVTYEGMYFELITDINLNNNAWTPIGDNDSSFRGVFNGGGHIISNATITTFTTAPTDKYAYGFFGSIGGGATYATIKNLQFDNINISIAVTANLSSNSGGIHVGIVTGKMYKCSEIINVIASNCTISNTNAVTIRTSSFQVFVGGIAGFATNTTNSETDPGVGNRYSIENCFSNVAISLSFALRSNMRSYAGQYAVGGIIGAIRSQPVWPENCLYTGNINATYGFTGPIFAYLRDDTNYTTTTNFPTLWYGEDAGSLNMTSYYTNYTTNAKRFTSTYVSGNTPNTTTYRVATRTTGISNTQGMNKGNYITDITDMLINFNTYVTGTDYTRWVYEDETYSFVPRIDVDIDDTDKPTYTIDVVSNYNANPTYTYVWKVNGITSTTLIGNTVTQTPSMTTEYNYEIFISDGIYFAVANFTIPQLELHINFTINNNEDSVTATLAGTGLPYVNITDYTYQWNKSDITGMINSDIAGATSLTLQQLEEEMDYTIYATNTANNEFSVEGTFTYGGDRTVIYVKYNGGSNNNDGLTPQTPVQTMATAYSKLTNTEKIFLNVVVVMEDYINGDFLNTATGTTYAKKATVMGRYKQNSYNGRIYFAGDKFITKDTIFQYISFLGYDSDDGTGQGILYAQGHNLTMGEGIYMERYTTSNKDSYALANGNAPDFHIVGAFLNYNRTSIPTENNNGTILIKSGTYSRVIAGTRNTGENYTSDNITGSSNNHFNINIIVNIQNSTTPSNYANDINMLVGGQTDGSIYADSQITIRSGTIGRILGGSIGYNRPISGAPSNTFIGSTIINVSGGTIGELYGASLGRQKSDVYFYGPIVMNISGGTITQSIYGAGGGGTTGYNQNNSDPYRSYGFGTTTTTTINISGGYVNGNVYGGGYGYSAYLDATTIATDGGALYGASIINITAGEINGNIYGAGRGYVYTDRESLAQLVGSSTITVSGTPTIHGNIFGAGEGTSRIH